jgi:two-component system NarL family response regulator
MQTGETQLSLASQGLKFPEPPPRPRHPGPIRLVLVDDHPVVRRGIASFLAGDQRFKVEAEAGDGREALETIRAVCPDLVLMDLDLPGMSGLAVTEILRQEMPEVKILIVSMFRTIDYVSSVMASGAAGYLLKESPPEEIKRAIELIMDGQAYFSAEVARVALNQFVRGNAPSPLSTLTEREREVLIQIAEGFSNKEIGSRLGVGVRTVETHRERIMRKLQIHSVAGLTKFALAHGLVSLPQEYRPQSAEP